MPNKCCYFLCTNKSLWVYRGHNFFVSSVNLCVLHASIRRCDMRDDVEDIEDYIPEKSITICPSCKRDEEKMLRCFLCKGKGFLLISDNNSQWVEDG